MEVLIHFVFQLFKIAFLAIIYSVFLRGVLFLVSNFLNRKIAYKGSYYMLIYVLLLVFSFTYYGNHGLGDGPRIPIGNWKTIENVNWEDWCYIDDFKSKDGKPIHIDKFFVKGNKLCGLYDNHFYKYENDYFVINLNSKQITEFKTREQYNAHALENKLPIVEDLISFEKNYTNYWGGIRFFLLP